jgi:hypothetical protein
MLVNELLSEVAGEALRVSVGGYSQNASSEASASGKNGAMSQLDSNVFIAGGKGEDMAVSPDSNMSRRTLIARGDQAPGAGEAVVG